MTVQKGGWDYFNEGFDSANRQINTNQTTGTLETRWFTIDDAADCITTAATPAAAELLTATFDGTKKRCRVSFHVQTMNAATGVPDSPKVLVAINAADDAAAVTAFTFTDNGAASTATTDQGCRMISEQIPVIEYDFTTTSSYVDRIDVAGVLPTGTGTMPVSIFIEVW